MSRELIQILFPIALLIQPLAAVAASATYKVQLAAYRGETDARACWETLKAAHPDLLVGLEPHFERADLGSDGIYYRVQVGAFENRNAAEAVCGELRSRNLSCFVVRSLSTPRPSFRSDLTSPVDAKVDLLTQRVSELEKTLELQRPPPPEPPGSGAVPPPERSHSGTNGTSSPANSPPPNPEPADRQPATAGDPPRAPVRSASLERPLHNGFVHAIGGVTFDPRTSGLAGAAVGFRILAHLKIVGEVGRLWDVSRPSESFALSVVGFDFQRPCLYGMAGIRLVMPMERSVSPYITASLGAARLSRKARIMLGARDITADVRVIGADFDEPPTTELAFGLGGGVHLGPPRGVSLDLGYQYLFISPRYRINVSRAYLGVGYGF